MNLSSISHWAEAHPTLVALVVVPLCTAVFNLLLKPKTPEQYEKIAAISPRLAAFLQLVGALGVDPTKAAKIFVEKIVNTPNPPPPSGPSRVPSSDPPPSSSGVKPAARMLLIAAAFALMGCHGANAPREQARSVVLTVAEGVKVGDEACASVALAKKDAALAEQCAALVSLARESLITAEEGVDAWDATAVSNLPCAVKSAASALSRLLGIVEAAGGKAPPVVQDALLLAPALTGACRG
jgi:hypothetical protein